MDIYIEKNFEDLSKFAAKIIADHVRQNPNIVLGLATGSTPVGTYKELVRMHKDEELDFSKVVTFNLDEYYNISPSNPQSYNYYMRENLFNHININFDNIHIPCGEVSDVEKFCKMYDEEIIKYGGIDLQILGIGENGHIGFNEPDNALDVATHLTSLNESTIKANSSFFESIEDVPTKAITMGLGSIMKSKEIILLANGDKKAKIISKILTSGKAMTEIPASALLLHKNVTVILDESAASIYKLQRIEELK